ncbi:ribonuclease BN [Helicobacter mustelae]|uniref:YihY family inner membrane protein n=1 Tax=Helicobacter mustelae TaxID=217 RepID=UPI000E065EB5|nr:YihY family inner membrane protein [Helicobacter mustelae]STP13128.1 ribonuclease BN [Helicobacter mustelae]
MRRFTQKIQKNLSMVYNFLTHEQEIFYYAASLSFYTIFAIIPLLFIIFSILSHLPSFQYRLEDVRNVIFSYIIPMDSDILNNMLNDFMINAPKMGMVGFVYIIFTSLFFFRNYEFITSRMFNSKPRKILDSLMVHWLLITFFPIMIMIFFYGRHELKSILTNPFLIFLSIKIAPWIVNCLFFMMLFQISANKTLNKKILIFSSFLCASMWQFFKWAFFYYVTYNKAYPSLYGSISILPIFMLWIYISWTILLFGMRLCEGMNIFTDSKEAAKDTDLK